MSVTPLSFNLECIDSVIPILSILQNTLSKDVETADKGIKREEIGEVPFVVLVLPLPIPSPTNLPFPEQARGLFNVAKLRFWVSSREEVAQTFHVPGAGMQSGKPFPWRLGH